MPYVMSAIKCTTILRILQLFIFSVNFRECALKIVLTRSNFQPKMLAGVKGPTSKGRGGEGGEIFLSSFWGLRPQTPTGALPLVPICLYCLNCTTFA